MRARVLHRAGPQRQPAHRVQCLAGEDIVAHVAGDLVAAFAQLARPGRLVAVMQHDGQAPQRFGEDCSLAVALSGGDRGFVTVNRFGDTGVPLTT